MAGGEGAESIVLRVFGRPPCPEDWSCVGRWSFAAAWLAEDDVAARELVRARLAGACSLATSAAMAAGRGDAERFTLVTALARLATAFEGGGGPMKAVADGAVERASDLLFREGVALRSAVARERAALAPRFDLETLARAMLEVGSERHVLLRDGCSNLEEALASARGDCPALRTLRLFLQATLSLDGTGLSFPTERGREGEEPFGPLRAWLRADLALSQRRVGAFATAWAKAARESGDALSLALAAVSSGGMVSHGLVEALEREPWALPLALAATSEPDHASMLLDFGGRAQTAERASAAKEIAAWRDQASVVEELENVLGLPVIASATDRNGFRDLEDGPGQDLFTAWSHVQLAREGTSALRQSADRSLANEMARLVDEVRGAEAEIEASRRRYEAEIALATVRETFAIPSRQAWEASEARGQKGCLLGLGAGAGLLGAYVLVGLLVGTGRAFERIAPLVVCAATVPVSAGILAYVGVVAHRIGATFRQTRRFERSRGQTARIVDSLRERHAESSERARRASQEAKANLSAFERRLSTAREAA